MDTSIADRIEQERQDRRKRDEAIVAASQAGERCAEIARRFGMSRANVAERLKYWKRHQERRASTDPFERVTLRTARLLRANGLTTVEQVNATAPGDLLAIRHFGYKSLREVELFFRLSRDRQD